LKAGPKVVHWAGNWVGRWGDLLAEWMVVPMDDWTVADWVA
jgi:hypothetical protein